MKEQPSLQQNKNNPIFKLYQLSKRSQKIMSDFMLWTATFVALENVLAHAKSQTQIYADKTLQSTNYFKEIFLPKLLEKISNSAKVTITIDGKKIKNILQAKWDAINQSYFNEKGIKRKPINFFHPRLGKFFESIFKQNIKTPKKYYLKKEALSQLIIKYQKKMLSRQFIAIQGLMLSGKYDNYKKLINIQNISDQKHQIQITYEPMFQVSVIKRLIEQKPFTNVNTQKLLKNVKGQNSYQNVGKQEFKDAMRFIQADNSSLAFLIIGCCLQLEYINQYCKDKKVQSYIQNFAITEGHTLAKGVIIGQLYQLHSISVQNDQSQDEYEYEYEQQTEKEEFMAFFGNLFTDDCDQKDLVQSICKGIFKYKIKNPNLSTQQVIEKFWCKQ